MKISIIVESGIEKSIKETLKDIASMVDELCEHYPSVINGNDVEITITV